MATYVQEFTTAVCQSQLPPPARQILLTLALWSNYSNGHVPAKHTRSLTGISKATGLQRSTVAKYLKLLEDAAWLTRHVPPVSESRRGARTWYELTVGKPALDALAA